MATVEGVLNIARSQLGYQVPGPPRYSKYGEWEGINPAPYCDMFVSWVFFQGGIGDFGKQSYCPSTVNYWKNKGRLFSTPQAGDQVIYFWNGVYAHTGIVERVDGDNIITIEGNTAGTSGSQANGGAVLRKVRLWRGTRAVFGRPDYASPAPGPVPVGFAINPPLVLRPIVAEWSPGGVGLVLLADNGDAYAFANAPYPGHAPALPPGVVAHDPIVLQPIVAAWGGGAGETGGKLLAADGSVYAFAGTSYHGGANQGHDTYFAGRLAADFRPHPSNPASYCIVATSGELYCDPF